ncbi:MAG TPA: hypothetical protein VN999_10060 [Thermoanaerobaculia bacterium]|nr:hypothetical protein [Thermoanaerobaculia bacterium]
MKSKVVSKLTLHRETLHSLKANELSKVAAATVRDTNCGFNCSVVATCPVTHCTG